MKGVILAIAADCQIVDITHEGGAAEHPPSGYSAIHLRHPISPGNDFHVAVVDRGVGTDRALLAVQAGVKSISRRITAFSPSSFERNADSVVHKIENRALFLPQVSRTFHGSGHHGADCRPSGSRDSPARHSAPASMPISEDCFRIPRSPEIPSKDRSSTATASATSSPTSPSTPCSSSIWPAFISAPDTRKSSGYRNPIAMWKRRTALPHRLRWLSRDRSARRLRGRKTALPAGDGSGNYRHG